MRKLSYIEKKEHIKQEKILENKHYGILIVFAVLDVIYYFFFSPKIIGNDIRYSIFIFWIPFIIGIFGDIYFRRKYLQRIKKFNLEVIAIILFLLFEGSVFSYIVFGMPAKMGFDGICYLTAKKNFVETIEYNVNHVNANSNRRNRRQYVLGELNGDYEHFYASKEYIKQFSNINPQEYKIIVNVQKGIWNHYLVNNWYVSKKSLILNEKTEKSLDSIF